MIGITREHAHYSWVLSSLLMSHIVKSISPITHGAWLSSNDDDSWVMSILICKGDKLTSNDDTTHGQCVFSWAMRIRLMVHTYYHGQWWHDSQVIMSSQTRQVLGSLSEVWCDSTKPIKIFSEQELIFGKTVKNDILPWNYWRTPLNKWIWIKLNIQGVEKIEAKNANIYLYIFCLSAKSSMFLSQLALLSSTVSSFCSGPPYKTALLAHSTIEYS